MRAPGCARDAHRPGTHVSATGNERRARRCFVCGPDNPAGLKLQFRMDGDVCRSEFTPRPEYAGFDGITHGGILFSVLDDVMANWLWLRGEPAYTAKSEVRYREAVPTGTPLSLEGRLVNRKGRLAAMESVARRASDGQVMVEARASFFIDAG